MSERELFIAALQKENLAERQAYLDAECVDRPELREQVQGLLRLYEDAGSFLQKPAAAGDATCAFVPTTATLACEETPGTLIGPYKLLQQIGEGGMGTVYMAEQTEPVKRKVALKLIKAGMDSRQVVARFEAERQALAMMDHVNIARVFDGGTTENGRPYFVMELVHGVPITKYCDDNHLTPRERLELFVPVCQAIQHAHQKGIIHRDIKPSNVMITLYDGKPVPKVIDFGVAKATEQKLTERTLFTQYGSMIGTLEYMSPEQAEMSALGVDTRSDIYSLGVLLYELLTGSTPLTHKRMKEAAYGEILRMIKEEEPPKPSTRLSDSGEALASISAQRKTEPGKLSKLVRGELDWIVMKTLEKDRNRRYETANAFAADVQRYLSDETVQACPPSAGYRFRKFARRNKRALVTATALGMALLVAVGAVAGSIGWAARDREARQAKVVGQVELIIGEVERLEQEQKWPEALAVAKRAEAVLVGDEADPAVRERVHQALADLEMVAQFEEIRLMLSEASTDADAFDPAATAGRYAAAFRDYGVDIEAIPADQAADRLRSHTAIVVPLAAALDDWGQRCREKRDEPLAKKLWALAGTIDPDPWRLQVRQAVADRDVARLTVLAESGETTRQPPQSQMVLAMGLSRADRRAQAIALLERASEAHPADFWIHFELAFQSEKVRPRPLEAVVRHYTAARALNPRSGTTWNNLGNPLKDQGRVDEAIACYRKAIEINPKDAGAHYNLGLALYDQKKLDAAIAAHKEAIRLNPGHAEARGGLGMALTSKGQFDEAIALYKEAIRLKPDLAEAHFRLGEVLRHKGEWNQAIACYRQAIRLKPDHAPAHNNLGILLIQPGQLETGQLDEAIASLREALRLKPDYFNAAGGLGQALVKKGLWNEAIASFERAIRLRKDVDTHNELAWLLATCPDAKVRDPSRAVRLAEQAVKLAPKQGGFWNTLGVAQYRAGNWKACIAALEKVPELQPSATSFDWFFQAMAHWQLGDKDRARQYYQQAVDWMDKNHPKHEELGRFRAEAAALLGVAEQPKPKKD